MSASGSQGVVQRVDVRDLDERTQEVFAGCVVDYRSGHVADCQNRLVTRHVGIERDFTVDELRVEAERRRVAGERRLEVFDEDVRNCLLLCGVQMGNTRCCATIRDTVG